MIDRHVERYLASRALAGPWTFAGIQGERYAGAVVIPSLAESRFLFSTLHSLAHNPPDLLSRFLILVVVNHRQDASPSEKADNQETLRMLSCGEPSLAGLQLAWVDAASPGLELPAKTGGVGMARKIGFGLALTHLNYGGTPPF